MMENTVNIKQEETISDTQGDSRQKLHPFVCGLCDCSYGQFVSFYKHFKKHSKEVEVGQDSFHICEELPSSERDVCEDQSGSLEMQTFNCGMCPASFITVCLLHEHMKNHESKGSYTLDMQSRTGYPSSKQYPCVSLGNVETSSLPTSDGSLSKSGVSSKRGRNSKRGPPGNAVSMPDTEKRKKRSRPPNNVPPPKIGVRTRRSAILSVQDSEIKNESSKPSDKVPPPPQVSSGTVPSSPLLAPDDFCSDAEDNTENDIPSQYGLLDAPVHSESDRPSRDQWLCTKLRPTPTGVGHSVARSHQGEHKDASASGILDAPVNPPKSVIRKRYRRVKGRPRKLKHLPEHLRGKKRGRPSLPRAADGSVIHPDRGEEPIEDPEAYVRVTRRGKQSGKAQDDVKVYVENAEEEGEEEDDDDEDEMEEEAVSGHEDDIASETQDACSKTENLKVGTGGEEILEGEEEAKPEGLTKSPLRRKQRTGRKKISKVKREKQTDQDMYDEDYEPGKNPVKHTKRVKVLHYNTQRIVSKCNLCGLLIANHFMRKHQIEHKTQAGKRKFRPENLIKCKDCDRVLLRKGSSKHKCIMTVIKEDEESKRRKRGKTEEEWAEKRRIAKTNSMVPCHICGNRYSRTKLKDHMYTHQDGKSFHCSKCSGSFKTPSSLKVHTMYYHGEKNYRCDQCDRAFATMNKLNIHYTYHSGERPCPCPKCGKQFRHKGALSHHMYTHAEVNQFRCKECIKTFKTSYYLKNHVRTIHKRDRRWICSWPSCEQVFMSGSSLRRHMITHTGEKPEKCTRCDSAFSQRGELRLHLSKKHNTDDMPPSSQKNPYADATTILIKPPASGEDTDQPDSDRPFKTLSFNSGMSKVDIQALQQHMASQTKRRKLGRSGQKAAFSVDLQSSLGGKDQSLVSRNVSEANTEKGTSDLNNRAKALVPCNVSDANVDKDTSGEHFNSHTNLSVLNSSVGTNENTEIRMAVETIKETISEPLSSNDKNKQGPKTTTTTMLPGNCNLPLLSNTKPNLETSNTSSEVIQETSSSSIYRNIKPELEIGNTSSKMSQQRHSLPLFSNTRPEIGVGVSDSTVLPGNNTFSMYRHTKPELGPSNTVGGVMQGTSSLSMYRHANPDVGTNACNAIAGAMQGPSILPMYRHTKPELGTGNTFSSAMQPSMQGPSSLSMPLEYAGSQSTLVPSTVGFPPDFLADSSVLTTMAATIPHPPGSS